MLHPVASVFVFVDDLDAARAWYAERLSLEPVAVREQLVRFDIETTTLTVHMRDRYNSPGPAGSVAYFQVDDVDTLVAEWVENGAVVHRGPKTVFSGERLCQLLDPFGNLFGMLQAPVPDPG